MNETKLAIDINQFIVSVVVWWRNGNHTAETVLEIPVLFIDVLVVVAAVD